MPIQPGQVLLHYTLVDKIGEGGMGVVWRATDATLARDVAIKLLPEALSAEPERLQRFEREARVLASLNHPHIATIHGLHEAPIHAGGSVRFLVMELVEGEDLQQRLARAPLPLERALEIAMQVALALETAHAQGVVHRDLKPANVKLTASGDAKVLDFGLAKALAYESASGAVAHSPSMSPTMTSAGTVAGMILGTAAYMSPEQARGKTVDKRADMWAFGCLLYEMLARRRCFDGETISDTLASVLKEQPDWTPLPAETPPAIRRLLRRCLAKDPRQRLSDAADARLELNEAAAPPHPGELLAAPSAAGTAGRATGGKLPWGVAALAIVAAAASWLIGGRDQRVPAREPLELSISIPPGITLNDVQETMLELSPDGRYLVFDAVDREASSPSLYLRKLDDSTVVKLPDTVDAVNPFFSPDSRWIGFFADGQLKKLQVDGTAAVPICEVKGNPRGASWGADDRIVYPEHFTGPLIQVRASGGTPTPLTELDAERRERTHRWPQIVPGHDIVLFTVATTDSSEFYDDARIDALRISTGERKTVFEGASFARYVATGHLVIARGGFLFGVPFDIERLEATGTPVPVVEDVMGAPNSGAVYASIARTGLLAYVRGNPTNPRGNLTWMHMDGRTEAVPGSAADTQQNPSVSPDGQRIALAVSGDRAFDIWVLDLARGSRTRLTFDGDDNDPVWTPDGKSVVFSSVRGGMQAAYLTAADGSGGERLVHAVEGSAAKCTDVSPDGRLALLTMFGENKADIVIKSLVDPDAPAVPFLAGPADEQRGRFSPDGRWIAYTSDESGDYQVFVRPYPGPGGRWQISTRGGADSSWSPDGRRIHYRTNREWWVVDVDPGDGRDQPFRAGVPQLVRNDFPRVALASTFGIAHDGRALLVMEPEEERRTPLEVTVFVDWLTELERLVPR